MRVWLIILILLVSIVVSALLFYYQNHLQFLGNISLIIPFLPLIGLVNIVKLITELKKETALKYGDIYIKAVPYSGYDRRGYFLNIKRARGLTAKKCHGLLKIKGSEINNQYTNWYDTVDTHIDIDDDKDLALFEIDDRELKFNLVSNNKERFIIKTSYDDSFNKKLDVTIGADSATPIKYSKKLSEIIRKAKDIES